MMKTKLFILFMLMACSSFVNVYAQKIRCSTDQNLQQIWNQFPQQKSQLDSFQNIYFNQAKLLQHVALGNKKSVSMPVRYVPVVVHVLYNNTSQNISNAQIQSQIDILNNDYLAMNDNLYRTQSAFVSRIGISGIQFYIANKAPNGADTIGIIRTSTTKLLFNQNDSMKHSLTGGDDAWDPTHYLNIWVCVLKDGSLLGFSSLPGTTTTLYGNDGIVIDYRYFGKSGIVNAPYHLGRTATHEIGHYFGLIHTFENGCSTTNDNIADTPPLLNASSGCNYGVNTCSSDSPDMNDMNENFMDYSDDDCMTMFTNGQVAAMQIILTNFRTNLGFDSTITFSTKIGIENKTVNTNPFTIYPNPCIDELTINSANLLPTNNVEVYNTMGVKINCNCSIQNSTCVLDTKNLIKGFYVLKNTTLNGEAFYFQFIKN